MDARPSLARTLLRLQTAPHKVNTYFAGTPPQRDCQQGALARWLRAVARCVTGDRGGVCPLWGCLRFYNNF